MKDAAEAALSGRTRVSGEADNKEKNGEKREVDEVFYSNELVP